MRRIWLAAALALLLAVSAAASADTFYVYTENGKTLNLRSATNNSVIANIPYGTALEPDSELSTETAAYVTYKDKSGYVKWKYLVKEKPAPKKRAAATAAPEAAQAPAGTAVAAPAYAQLFNGFQMNRRQATLQQAAPMRWVPEATAPVMRNYPAGQTFEVLLESSLWCQVIDTAAGLCGYVPRSMLN